MARKTDVIDLLITELKRIDGSTDNRTAVQNVPYTYNHNLHGNVFRIFKFLKDINDFPTITLMIGTETRQHIGGGVKYATLDVAIRGYTRSENALDATDDLIEDIEHSFNALGFLPELCPVDLVDSRIVAVSTDEGLFEPHGIADVEAQIVYEVSEAATNFLDVFTDGFAPAFR